MEILPSEYQNIELSRYEKMFVRHAISDDGYGFLLLKVNPTMIENESMNVLISSRGVTIFYKGIMPSEKILDFPVDCNFLTGSVNL